jgi:hypothetical protein
MELASIIFTTKPKKQSARSVYNKLIS